VAVDKPLSCADCGKQFIWTSEEQEMFQRRGFSNEPKRCPHCRKQRRDSKPRGAPRRDFGGGGGGFRETFTVACAKCGRDAVVPFKPRGDRPVFCNECFRR
jgi:CxxC-x17-CxxC domain-containing protein